MDEEIPITQDPPKRKRGWQKGRPRGPRKPVDAPQTPDPSQPLPRPIPPAPTPPEPSGSFDPSEVVKVQAKLVSGITLSFRAMRFDVENGRYSFTSYPAMRGFKTVTYLRNDQLAMLEITAPEDMMEKLKAAPVVVVPPPLVQHPTPTFQPEGAMVPHQGPIVYGNPLLRPPYAGGDPRQMVRDAAAQAGETIRNPAGIPASVVSTPGTHAPDPRGVLASKGVRAEPPGTENILATMG